MSIEPGTHRLGPENATLVVRTSRRGGAAKAGHDLLIEVTSWSATIEADPDPTRTRMTLSADSGSFKIVAGTGGIMPLGEGDKDAIRQTIDDELLKRTAIEFRSASVLPADGGRLKVRGELELLGRPAPVSFVLHADDDGRLHGSATLAQTDWGLKPYSTLFGALKVADEVTVELDGTLHSPQSW
jgi:polyisoprenoid-binding protein YceI